ncbi:hypothetical protein QTO30_19670 [Yoonia sp. GPGPB17]|uniref:hypothetical protein n=1 Tax=Yoonia sp. GPGPB17 TaxID=3026147 RepID=UPI0030C36585
MNDYSVDQLASDGARYALGLLLQRVTEGDEPFVTYKEIVDLLQSPLKIPIIFPIHIGAVAGQLMSDVHAIDPQAPLINALVTRADGLPDKGFGSFYNPARTKVTDRTWEQLARKERLSVLAEIRASVRRYPDWDDVFRKAYGVPLSELKPLKSFAELDGKTPETGGGRGGGESDEHKALKIWASANPAVLGIAASMLAQPEAKLLSGDRVDVLFSDGKDFVAIEVKSCRSGPDDWQRGIYQCLKYMAILRAQEYPVPAKVSAVLLTEAEVTPKLKARAKALGVTLKVHQLHKDGT